MQKLRIGIPQSDYNVERNIVGSLPVWALRVRPLERHRILTALKVRLGAPISLSERFTFRPPFFPGVDLLHFFNAVSPIDCPWITTFETSLPRWGEVSPARRRQGATWLFSKACRRMLALSDAAVQIALAEWVDLLGEGAADELRRKTEVLMPPQRIVADSFSKPTDGITRFAFVGADFYRKGGLEVLKALKRLKETGRSDWQASIVGKLGSFGDYASRTDASHHEEARALLAGLGGLVRHVDRASRVHVLSLLLESDFFLFPTLADTFGYSVLEAQACGAVVISTNLRALPEVNSARTGVVIDLPLDHRREFHRHAHFEQEKSRLVDGILASLWQAIEMPAETRARLANAAFAQLRSRHDPERHRARMEQIYRDASGLAQ
jgi:glycosyltransferase involved in cell wall biosynthesis